MSRTITVELDDAQAAGLETVAQRMGTTLEGASARLVEEELRRIAFPGIEFRDSAIGRLSYVIGSSLAAWEVLMVASWYDYDPVKAAEHLDWPLFRVEQSLAYTRAYPAEGADLVEQNRSMTEDDIRRALPPGMFRESEPVRF